jgi:hypothetical protein
MYSYTILNYKNATIDSTTTTYVTDDALPTFDYISSLTTLYSTASQLSTTRYLWGRPFNGTSDVSGMMTGVSYIVGTGTSSKAYLSLADENGRILIRPAGTDSSGCVFSTTYFRPYTNATG